MTFMGAKNVSIVTASSANLETLVLHLGILGNVVLLQDIVNKTCFFKQGWYCTALGSVLSNRNQQKAKESSRRPFISDSKPWQCGSNPMCTIPSFHLSITSALFLLWHVKKRPLLNKIRPCYIQWPQGSQSHICLLSSAAVNNNYFDP